MNFPQWFMQYAASHDWTVDERERCVAEAAWHAGRDALREEAAAERNNPTSEPLEAATATRGPQPGSNTTPVADTPQAEELTDAQAQAAGYNWCPTCNTWVPRSEVTVDEHHGACGAYVACFPGARWVGVDLAGKDDE